MTISLSALLWEIDGFRFRRSIRHALALNLRNEVRPDGLVLSKAFSRLDIEWHARDIHPWDRDRNISPENRAIMFVQQCLSDTESAILRLFERLPQVESIEVRVLEPKSNIPIITGTVARSSLETNKSLSVGMRLMLSGMTFCLSDWQSAALKSAGKEDRKEEPNQISDAQPVGHF